MSWAEIGDALNSTKKNPNLFKPLDEWLKYRGGDITYEYESAGTFSLTIPEWATIAIVTACGAGGGGGWGNSYYVDEYTEVFPVGGGGSGGAAVYNQVYDVTGGGSLNITVGKGGSGAIQHDSTNATNGGSTIIGNLMTLAGGNKGGNAASSGSSEINGTGGASAGAGSGKGGSGTVGSNGIAGAGGQVKGGGGGSLGNGGSSSSPVKGGGGAGGTYSSSDRSIGQSGADGYVRIVFK